MTKLTLIELPDHHNAYSSIWNLEFTYSRLQCWIQIVYWALFGLNDSGNKYKCIVVEKKK